MGESYNFVNSLGGLVRELVVACWCATSDLGIFTSMQIAGYQSNTVLLASKAVPTAHA
jgi:hypothetical protein